MIYLFKVFFTDIKWWFDDKHMHLKTFFVTDGIVSFRLRIKVPKQSYLL